MEKYITPQMKCVSQPIIRYIPALSYAWLDMQAIIQLKQAIVESITRPYPTLVPCESGIKR